MVSIQVELISISRRIISYLFHQLNQWGDFPVGSVYMAPLVPYKLMKKLRFSLLGAARYLDLGLLLWWIELLGDDYACGPYGYPLILGSSCSHFVW